MVKKIGNLKQSSSTISSLNFEPEKNSQMPQQSSSHNKSTNGWIKVRRSNFFHAQQFFFWLNCQQSWHANYSGYDIGMLIVRWNWIKMQYWSNSAHLLWYFQNLPLFLSQKNRVSCVSSPKVFMPKTWNWDKTYKYEYIPTENISISSCGLFH